MKITREELFHLAALSSLSLSDDEADALLKDVENIIKYISMLDELDAGNVEPTYQVFEMENAWRPDEVEDTNISREALLALTAESKDHQIKIPKVLVK
jgi:aspartyl-tRNA(Asn)/glutamyl-tRNA(Gln) amidotransferase subunit C